MRRRITNRLERFMTTRAWRVSVPALAGTRPRMGRAISGLRWGALGVLAGLLGACGYFGFGGSQAAPVAHARSRKAHVQPPVDPAAKALAAMVEAVGPSSAQPPIELRFSIRARPE